MWPSSDSIKLFIAIAKRLKWLLILALYTAILEWEPVWGTIVLGVLIAAGFLAYQKDIEREQAANDDFSGGGLFYRYGHEKASFSWPIPVPAESNSDGIEAFADSLRRKLADKLRQRLPSEAVHVLEPVSIRNSTNGASKQFVRIFSRSPIGSTIVHFFHLAPFGRTLTLRLNSFVRGSHTQLDVLKFAAAAPITIWAWGLRWLMNQFSILSHISRFAIDSYDDMDVDTIFTSTYFLAMDETRNLLEEEGLLTEELKQTIFQTITNNQSVSVTNASGVHIGAVSQTAPAPAPKATKAA